MVKKKIVYHAVSCGCSGQRRNSVRAEKKEIVRLNAQGIPVTRRDPETGKWRYKPENDAENQAMGVHIASLKREGGRQYS
jgi:hypothetical protein